MLKKPEEDEGRESKKLLNEIETVIFTTCIFQYGSTVPFSLAMKKQFVIRDIIFSSAVVFFERLG